MAVGEAPTQSKPQPRVLVIRGGAIGDFILTLPAIRLLREGIPNNHLEVLGYPGICDLAVTAGLADGVRSLEHRSFAPLFARGGTIEESLAGWLRSFNLIVSYLYDPNGIFRDNLQLAGVRTLIEMPHRVQPGAGHAAEQLARPLERLAFFLEDASPRLHLQDQSRCGSRVVLHPGSGSTTKNWPVENWATTGRDLLNAFPDLLLTLVTGDAERERGITDTILAEWQSLNVEHWDGLPLPQLAQRLASAAAFLGQDSGISHLAAACGVPCLLIFGPTDPAVWAPRNPGTQVLQAPDGDFSKLPPESFLQSAIPFISGKIRSHSAM